MERGLREFAQPYEQNMIELRDLRPQDSEQLRQWRNSPEVAAYMYTDHEISPEEHAAWFAGIEGDPTRKYWIIVYKGEDVGLVNLAGIDMKNRRSYWAFYVASPTARGLGVGSFVEWAILGYAFDNLKLNKLCAEVLSTTPTVVALHKRFGFVEEGRLRQHIIKNGQFVDVVTLGLLASEWEQVKPSLQPTIERVMKHWSR